jgi:hypothetical protein
MTINVDQILSFLLDELFFDWVGDRKVHVQDFIDQHLDDFILVSLEVGLDLANLVLSLSLQSGLKLLVFFLRIS